VDGPCKPVSELGRRKGGSGLRGRRSPLRSFAPNNPLAECRRWPHPCRAYGSTSCDPGDGGEADAASGRTVRGAASPVLRPPMRRRPWHPGLGVALAAGPAAPNWESGPGGATGRLSHRASFPGEPALSARAAGQSGDPLIPRLPVRPAPLGGLSYTPSVQRGGSRRCPTLPRRHGGAGVTLASYTPRVEGPRKPSPGDERVLLPALSRCVRGDHFSPELVRAARHGRTNEITCYDGSRSRRAHVQLAPASPGCCLCLPERFRGVPSRVRSACPVALGHNGTLGAYITLGPPRS
jgi:hypothetical protein